MASQTKQAPSLLQGAAGTARPVPDVTPTQASRLWFIDHFASAFSQVALYPLLKFGIAVLIVLPLSFLGSLALRKIPLANRML